MGKRPTLKLSDRGREEVDRARLKKGWTTYDERWLKAATEVKIRMLWPTDRRKITKQDVDVETYLAWRWQNDADNFSPSLSTLKRSFLQKRPIEMESFIALCDAVGVKWEDVVDADRSTVMGDPPEPTELFGRTQLLDRLSQCLMGRDRQRLVVLYGRAGIGKTAIALQLLKRVTDQFDCVIWQSLESAPPLADLVRQLVMYLSEGQVQQGTLTELMADLHQRRCLIVLDEWETIMAGQSSAQYRADYQDYSQLLRKISRDRHQSCLLLLSRKNPQTIDLKGAGNTVSILEVPGFTYAEDKDVLTAEGLTGTEAELQQFLEIYNNPLILKSIAEQVRVVHNGRVSLLVEAGASIFPTDDIEELIRSEFKVLTKAEKQIVYWLAIWHDPVSFDQLRQLTRRTFSQSELNNLLFTLIREQSLVRVKSEGDFGYFLEPVTLRFAARQLVKQAAQELLTLLTTQTIDQQPLFVSHAFVTEADEQLKNEQIRRIVKPIGERLLTVQTPVQLRQGLAQGLTQTTEGYAEQNIRSLLAVLP